MGEVVLNGICSKNVLIKLISSLTLYIGHVLSLPPLPTPLFNLKKIRTSDFAIF